MAALSANKERYTKVGNIVDAPVLASTTIYKGAYLMIDLSTGYVKPAVATNVSRGAGFAQEAADNSSGSSGDVTVRIELEDAVYVDGMTGLTQADLGKTVYASTDADFTLTASNNIPVGKIIKILSDTECEVKPEYGQLSGTV